MHRGTTGETDWPGVSPAALGARADAKFGRLAQSKVPRPAKENWRKSRARASFDQAITQPFLCALCRSGTRGRQRGGKTLDALAGQEGRAASCTGQVHAGQEKAESPHDRRGYNLQCTQGTGNGDGLRSKPLLARALVFSRAYCCERGAMPADARCCPLLPVPASGSRCRR